MNGLTDDAGIMRRIAERDPTALETLYDRYEKVVYSFAYRFVSDAMLAEEIVQELFVRLWNQPGQFDSSQGKLSTWIFAITRNIAIDQLRRRQNRTALQTTDDDSLTKIPDSHPTPEDQATDNMMATVVKEAILELNEDQQHVLDMIYFQGLTQQEVAEKRGIPLGTVKSRVRLALQQLRTKLIDSERRKTPNGASSK